MKAGNEQTRPIHATDYMVYAYLQLGPRRRGATRDRERDLKVKYRPTPSSSAAYATAAMPAR